MRCWFLISASMLAFAAAATTVVEDPPEVTKANEAWYASTVNTLNKQSDADALFTAALLADDARNPSNQALLLMRLDRAAAADPYAADIAAVDLMMCLRTTGCDADSRAKRLARAAPQDAQYLTPSLHASLTTGNEAAVTDALEHMASFETLHDYWFATAARIERALSRVAPAPFYTVNGNLEAERLSHASVKASLYLVTPFGDIVKACEQNNAVFSIRRHACGRIGDMLQQAESIASNMVGLRLSEWAATDDTQRHAIRQRRNQLLWLQSRYSETADTASPESAEALHAAMRESGSEIGGIKAVLRRAGEPLTPPSGWRPEFFDPAHPGKPISGEASD